jgi:heme/copper-type cytochrome/quinol oxidase subunit 2
VTDQNPQVDRSSRWWRWTILSVIGLMVLFVPLQTGATAPTERTIHIDARRFEYDPAILKVNPGDRVTIELVATDVVHGLEIDGYNISTTADPGKTARLTFLADRQGTFRFRCTATCGNMHPFMTGKLKVGQNTILWRAIAFTGLALVAGIWMGRK